MNNKPRLIMLLIEAAYSMISLCVLLFVITNEPTRASAASLLVYSLSQTIFIAHTFIISLEEEGKKFSNKVMVYDILATLFAIGISTFLLLDDNLPINIREWAFIAAYVLLVGMFLWNCIIMIRDFKNFKNKTSNK